MNYVLQIRPSLESVFALLAGFIFNSIYLSGLVGLIATSIIFITIATYIKLDSPVDGYTFTGYLIFDNSSNPDIFLLEILGRFIARLVGFSLLAFSSYNLLAVFLLLLSWLYNLE